MPGLNGTGPRGMGSMTGGGRGFCSPWGISPAFRARGISPRSYSYPYYGVGTATPNAVPFLSPMNRQQELDFLKNQAQAIRGQLEQITAKIQQLGNEA